VDASAGDILACASNILVFPKSFGLEGVISTLSLFSPPALDGRQGDIGTVRFDGIAVAGCLLEENSPPTCFRTGVPMNFAGESPVVGSATMLLDVKMGCLIAELAISDCLKLIGVFRMGGASSIRVVFAETGGLIGLPRDLIGDKVDILRLFVTFSDSEALVGLNGGCDEGRGNGMFALTAGGCRDLGGLMGLPMFDDV